MGGLIALGVSAGCASEAPAPPTTAPPGAAAPSAPVGSDPSLGGSEPLSAEQVEQSIHHSLERLAALRIIDVAQLVLDMPAGSTDCYGPCPGFEERYRAERARQAPRVESLATLAEATILDPNLAPHDKSEAGAALRALADLAVFNGASLVETKPVYTGQCYGICASDAEAADRENNQRVSQLIAIVAKAKDSGI
jgi:hypothetical protein